MPIHGLSDDALRSQCREAIESLEHWLRRLVEDMLSPRYGDIFTATDPQGTRLIRKKLTEDIDQRRAREPVRYPRKIDAVLLDDLIDIVCRQDLFPFFRDSLKRAFPEGATEARTFLARIAAPRNNLAHANSISHRQAEQVLCYVADVIDSLKAFYVESGMHQEYNVPLIMRVSDSFGNVFTRAQVYNKLVHQLIVRLQDTPKCVLRPGDMITINVEVDQTFDPSEYRVSWDPAEGSVPDVPTRFALKVKNEHVRQQWHVSCTVRSNRDWHRMGSYDDQALVVYKVLPPV